MIVILFSLGATPYSWWFHLGLCHPTLSTGPSWLFVWINFICLNRSVHYSTCSYLYHSINLVVTIFLIGFSTSKPFFKCSTLCSIVRPSTCHPIWDLLLKYHSPLRLLFAPGFPSLLWTSMIHIYKPSISRDPLTCSSSRLHSSNRAMVLQHLRRSIIFKRREGTTPLGVHTSRGLWGVLFFSVIALSHSPHTIALPLQYWCGCALRIIVHDSSYLPGQHISVLRSSSLLFATPTLAPRTLLPLSFSVFVWRLVSMVACFMSLSQNPWTLWNVDITLCS